MTAVSGTGAERPARDLPVMVVSGALIAEIMVNAYIIWFFVVGLPSDCSARVVATAGRVSCETGPAVPVVLLVSAALIIAGLVLLYRWHIQKKVS